MNGLFSVDCRRQLWWQKRRERKRITYHRRMRRVAGRVEAGEGSITCCLQLLTVYHLHLAPLPYPVLLHQLGGRQEVVVLEVIVDGPKHLVQEGLHGAVEVSGHTRQRVVLGTIPTNYAIQCYNYKCWPPGQGRSADGRRHYCPPSAWRAPSCAGCAHCRRQCRGSPEHPIRAQYSQHPPITAQYSQHPPITAQYSGLTIKELSLTSAALLTTLAAV